MKLYNNTNNFLFLWPRSRQSLNKVVSFWGMYTSKIQKGFSSFMAKLQLGRMESALSQMSDKQLEQVGTKRSDIKRYARHLVNYGNDGL